MPAEVQNEKSSRLLHNNTAARRSRQRQMFIKDARARRQARQEVFFIQENLLHSFSK